MEHNTVVLLWINNDILLVPAGKRYLLASLRHTFLVISDCDTLEQVAWPLLQVMSNQLHTPVDSGCLWALVCLWALWCACGLWMPVGPVGFCPQCKWTEEGGARGSTVVQWTQKPNPLPSLELD